MVLKHMCVIFLLLPFRNCSEGLPEIFPHDNENAKVLPDYGTKWFDQPKPKRVHGPPVGKPFLPDKQSPYKVYDAAVVMNPFNQENSERSHENAKTVTRSTQLNDSKLSQTINGDTYYGLNSPEDRNDFKEKASTYEQIQNDVENAKGLPYPLSDSISPEHIEEETRVVEQPLQHSASINNEFTQNLETLAHVPSSKLNSDHHSRSNDQHLREFDVNDLKKDDDSVSKLIDNIKDEDKTGVVHMSEADAKNNPESPKHESAEIPELDAISSETEALHLSKHFGDTFPQAPEESKNTKEYNARNKKHPKAHRYLPGHFHPLLEIIHSESEGKKVHTLNNKENRHHHLTIDTDTGEILNESKTSSGTGMPMKPSLKEHSQHSVTSKYHHNLQTALRHKKNRTRAARPYSRHQLHQPGIHFLRGSPSGIHRHEEQEINELDDESLKIFPSHRKHHFNDVGEGDSDLFPPQSYEVVQNEFTDDRKSHKTEHDEELSEITDIIKSDHDKERKSMPEVEEAHAQDETDIDDSESDGEEGTQNVHPAFASQRYNKDLETAISKNHPHHYGTGHSSDRHHNDGSNDHVHEDESFANEELENEEETKDENNSMKKSSKGHSLTKGRKKHYPNEPKIVKQRELVEPSFMLHEDPHGDGLGNGDITGIELGNTNNNTTNNVKNTKDPDKRWKDLTGNDYDKPFSTKRNISKDADADLKGIQEENQSKYDDQNVKETSAGNEQVKPIESKGKIKARIVSNKFITNIGTPQDEVNVEIDTKDIQNMIKSSLIGMSQEKRNITSQLHSNDKMQQPVLTDWEIAAYHAKDTYPKGKNNAPSGNSKDFYDNEISSFKGNHEDESKQEEKNINTDISLTKASRDLPSSNEQSLKNDNKEQHDELKHPSVNEEIKKVEQQDERKHPSVNEEIKKVKQQNERKHPSVNEEIQKVEQQNERKHPSVNEEIQKVEQQDERKHPSVNEEIKGSINDSNKDIANEVTDSDERPSKNSEKYLNDESLKPSVKHKLISNIQEHLKGFEIDELSAIRDQLQQLRQEKMKEDVKDGRSGEKTHDDRLDLDVKSTKYLIPDHQLTLPITNPGHPDDSNGVPPERNQSLNTKSVLLNPSPTRSVIENSGYIMEAVKTEKGSAKNIITHSKVAPIVKVTGTESEYDLQPFVVASKSNTLYIRHHHKYIDHPGNTRSMVTTPRKAKLKRDMSFKLDNIPTFKPNRSPINHYKRKATRLSQIIDKAPSHLEFYHSSPIQRTSLLTVSPLKPSIYRRALINAKERLDTPTDEYNAKQYFIKELVENIDKPKARRRVLSVKRNVEQAEFRHG